MVRIHGMISGPFRQIDADLRVVGMSHFSGDTALADDFLGVVHGTRSSRTPIETGLQSVYACLAARASANVAGFVNVRQVGA